MKGQPWLWLVVLFLSLPQIGWGQKNYTCDSVRVNPKTGRMVGWGGYYGFWERVKTKEEARQQLFGLQRWAQERSLKLGMENTAQFLDNAFYWLEKRGLLDCETKLEVIRRDLEFYNQHPDLLLGTYPWSVAGLPCARNWLKKELQRKDVSRLYHAWLIVEASRVWYEPYRDSLLVVIRDLSLHPDFRRQAMQIIHPEDYADSAVLQTAVFILEHDTSYIWLGTGLSKQRVKFQPTVAMALRILAQAGRKDLIPEKYKDSLEPLDLKDGNEKLVRMTSTDTARIEVAVYFKKDALIGETTPAWFWYWRQILDNLMPIQNLEIRLEPYGSCEALGEACYRWNTPYIVLTPAVSEERIIGDYRRSGIDYMAVAIYHEKAHKDLFENVWRDLLCVPDPTTPTGYACDLSQEARLQYDHDTTRVGGVLWMDDLPDQWEQSPHRVGNLTIQFNPHWPTTASFYGYVDVDGELWAMLHECLWQEGSADSLDWSWGEYAKQMDVQLAPVPSPPDFQIVHPVGNSGRRWIYDPSVNKMKTLAGKVPAEDGVPIRADALNDSIIGFWWTVDLWGNIVREFTAPGQLKTMELTPVIPLASSAFGRKWLTVVPERNLCADVSVDATPKSGEMGVPVTAKILLAFSHPMDTASVRQGSGIHERIYIPSLNA